MARLRAATFAATLAVTLACGEEPALTPVSTSPSVPTAEAEELLVPLELTYEAHEIDLWEDPRRGPPYPIILVHGFSGFHALGPLEYFFGVVDDLSSLGHDVYAPALPPYNGSDDRALVLAAFIDEVLAATGKEKVHLIGHSQGGVDCRRVVSGLGYAEKVASVTTVATPHRGTPLADLALLAPEGALNPAGRFLAWLIGLLDEPPNASNWEDHTLEGAFNPEMMDAIAQLSTSGMAAFNEAHPDPQGVPLFSVVGFSNLQPAPGFCDDGVLFDRPDRVDAVDPLLIFTGAVLAASGEGLSLRHNDGIVPSDSMVWGTLLGCVPADHFDEVGQIADLVPSLLSGFDHKALFRALVENARSVEPAPEEGGAE